MFFACIISFWTLQKLLLLDYEYDDSRLLLLDSLQLATGQEASDIMLKAILFQRKEFIDLLIMNGFLMQSFLTVKNLRILYQEGVRSSTEIMIYILWPIAINLQNMIDCQHDLEFENIIFRHEDSKNYKGKYVLWLEQVEEKSDWMISITSFVISLKIT